MSLGRRIKSLESRTGGNACPQCGHWPGGQIKFILVEGTPTGPEECPGCGRPLGFTLKLGENDLEADLD